METFENRSKSDQIFEVLVLNKVSYGKYQNNVCWLLALILLTDGLQMAAPFQFCSRILKMSGKWIRNLEGPMRSILFLGMFFGVFLCYFFTYKLGRKTTLECSSIANFFLGDISVTLQGPLCFQYRPRKLQFLAGVCGAYSSYVSR